ncbi:MAG: M1 family aminopeptidase [Nitrospirota bacterium]|jgi:hypothetical protein
MAAIVSGVVASLVALSSAAAQVHHRIVATLTPEDHAITASDRITLPAGTGSRLALRLSPDLTVDDVVGAGTWRRDGDAVIVERPGTELVVRYHGTLFDPPRPSGHLRFVAGDFTGGTIATEGVYLDGGSGWYPEPDLGLARFDLDVRVPEPLLAVSQGRLVAREGGLSRWRATLPADDLALVAGPYRVFRRQMGEIAVAAYWLRDDPASADLFLDAAIGYLHHFQTLLGPYPYARFDIVENFFSSGYGLPGFTLLGPGVIARGREALRPGYLDHEVAHNWWGNGVFVDPADGNWCEGLTSYCANYLATEAQGPAAALRARERWSQRYAIDVEPADEYPLRRFRFKTARRDDAIGYGKAAALFHQVRRRIGDDGFFAALRAFAAGHMGKRAGWDDLRHAFEAAAGKPLVELFRPWLEEVGGPRLALRGVHVEEGGGGWRLHGTVVQQGTPYPLDLDLRVESADGPVDHRLRLAGPATPFDLAFDRRPERLLLDPDRHLFRQLTPAEVLPCLDALLASRPVYYVVAADDWPVYRRLAEMARGEHGGEVLAADEVTSETTGNLWFLGRAAGAASRVGMAPPPALTIGAAGTALAGHPGDDATSILATWPKPGAPGRFVGLYWAASEEAAARAPYLFYYGTDSAIAFQGGRPAMRLQWQPADDPTVVVLERGSGE